MANSENLLEDMSRKSAVAEALSCINIKRVKKLAKFDGDFKSILKLANACKSLVCAKDSRNKTSWLNVVHALHEKIMSYDPLHINFIDKRRKDKTWCMWLTWNGVTDIGPMFGYSLVSECPKCRTQEEAAKSFVDNFCHVGPNCLNIYNSPYTSEWQRLANHAVVTAYKELGCPNTAEDVCAKLFASK